MINLIYRCKYCQAVFRDQQPHLRLEEAERLAHDLKANNTVAFHEHKLADTILGVCELIGIEETASQSPERK